jgi:hypothetical protein
MSTPTQLEDAVLLLKLAKAKQQASRALFLTTAHVLNS